MNHSRTNSHSPSPAKQEGIQSHDPNSDSLLQDFIQRRNYISKKMAQILKNPLQDENVRTMELRRLIFIKPQLKEAIDIQNHLLAMTNKDYDFSKLILKDLTRDIKLSRECLQNLLEFYETQPFLPPDELMKRTSHMIETTWQQIYKLSLYDPVLIGEISRLEWIFRAIDVLSHNRADIDYPYVEHCMALKKAALASQNDEITQSKFYKTIEEELQNFKDITHKVTLLFKQERKESSVKDLPKMNLSEVEKLLQDLKFFGFGMNQEIAYVEGVRAKALKIQLAAEKYLEFFHQKPLESINDLKKLFEQIKSFPVSFPGIEEHIENYAKSKKEQFRHILRETAQRILKVNKEVHQRYVKVAEGITIRNGVMIPSAEKIWQDYGSEARKITQYAENLIQNLHTFEFEDFFYIRQRMTQKGFERLKAELWLAQMKILRLFCEAKIKPSKQIYYKEIRVFLDEIKHYTYMIPKSRIAPFNEQASFLTSLIQRIRALVNEERAKIKKSGKKILTKVFFAFIDITKEVTEEKLRKNPLLHYHVESLNKKRNSENVPEINAFEKIEKKTKPAGVYQLVFPPSGMQVQLISDPENIQNSLKKPETPENQNKESFEQNFEDQNDLNGWHKKNQEESFENRNGAESTAELEITPEKMRETEDFFKDFNNDMLFDENFVFEDAGVAKQEKWREIDRLNEELWGDLDNGFKLKKKKKDSLANPQELSVDLQRK